MNKPTFLRKLRLFDRLRWELDEDIWRVFNKYIGERRINFNSPDTWEVVGDKIHFTGTDGCRGCYDRMELSIPIKYWEDYDTHTEEEFRLSKQKEEEEYQRQRRMEEARERRLLEELKKKYE